LTGRSDPEGPAEVRAHRPAVRAHQATPPIIHVAAGAWDLSLLPELPPADPGFVRAAGHAGRRLPAEVHDALVDFADEGHPSGALLLKGVPVGCVPATPDRPTAVTTKDHVSEFVLLTVARRLGQPVGYAPEHGGDVVQNILPTRTNAARQTSTSSAVTLMYHTEAAFHPHRPRFLLLLALRGDPEARTTLVSITDIVAELPLWARRTLSEPRFRLAVDESYLGRRSRLHGAPLAVLSGAWDHPQLVFDADLMAGEDDEATAALHELGALVRRHEIGVILEAGDLLVVDNSVAVHGRTPFTARFDGTDRWLQRSFVVTDLAPSAADRVGRVVTTHFAG
jgi:L-asparagine oxygenase